jgi:hypothetical protein
VGLREALCVDALQRPRNRAGSTHAEPGPAVITVLSNDARAISRKAGARKGSLAGLRGPERS